MKITKNQFLADVMHEINSLKANATKEELLNLNFDKFDYDHEECCIYGQITGDCTNERSHELMNKSCIRQFKAIPISRYTSRGFKDIASFINGDYDGETWNGCVRDYDYCSALEGYISLKGAKNKQIITYLRGETDTLSL